MKIEENFAEVEKILAQMESADTGLEDSFTLYEKGMKLLKEAGESIEKVESELKVLSKENEAQNHGF